MNTEQKRQHFVSQCYLKEFGFGSASHRKVRVVDIADGGTFNAPVKEVAQLESFNTLSLNGKPSNELESIVGTVERDAAPELANLRATGILRHSGTDAAVCFMSMFAVRSPFVRSVLDTVFTSIGTSAFQAELASMEFSTTTDSNIPPDLLRQYIQAQDLKLKPSKKLLIASELMLVVKLSKLLMSREWSLIDASSCKNQFVTSDRPVVLFKPSVSQETLLSEGAGFATMESIVHFPISPNLALHGTFEGYKYPPDAVDAELVASYNTKTIELAGSQIYYQGKAPMAMGSEGSLLPVASFVHDNAKEST